MLILEEQRYIHEDLERLEQGIADRIRDEPKHIRDRLNRDHEVSQLLDQIQNQSQNLLSIYKDESGGRASEIQQIGTGDPFQEFYKQLKDVRDHHARYPNEQAENSEQRYKMRRTGDVEMPSIVDSLFSGEEAYGRFFDLNICHESFLNLPNVKRLTYLQYLETFDNFSPGNGGVKRGEKLTDQYFNYVGELAGYLESFMKKTRPLENVDKILEGFDGEFETAWEKNEIPGWESEGSSVNSTAKNLSTADAVWCEDCEKEFKNENVYKGHLSGRRHIKAAEQRKQRQQESSSDGHDSRHGAPSARRLKEKAVAEREYRVKRLASAMSTERSDTRVNVERKQGMTERERQQELDNLLNMPDTQPEHRGDDEEDGEDGEERIYNPLKLPLAWDGKPIPFWLYRLHGLGVEFTCEICGNFVYMGRRAFDKHFNEARHVYGLKCLGINNTSLFRDIVRIDEAMKLWEKIQREKKRGKVDDGSVVQMEDAEGNVMPEKVYYDLQKQEAAPRIITFIVLTHHVATVKHHRSPTQCVDLIHPTQSPTANRVTLPSCNPCHEEVQLVFKKGMAQNTKALPALYTVYVLRSSVRHASLYIGSTPNPPRRLKQHNGEVKGGAARTSRDRLRPWEMIALVSGFPSMIAALKFEWALTNSHLSLHIPEEARLAISTQRKRNGMPARPRHSLRSIMSNIHLLTGVPSFEKWPLNLHFFHKDARAAWDHWLRSTAKAARASLKIHEDFAQDSAGNSAASENGIHGLPLDYSPMKEYVQKANDVVSFEQEGDCMHCKEKLDSGKGLHPMCPNGECVAMGHLDCWSRYALGSSNDGSIIPESCSCPACGGNIRWSDMMKELSLRVRGGKEIEKLLKKKQRAKKGN